MGVLDAGSVDLGRCMAQGEDLQRTRLGRSQYARQQTASLAALLEVIGDNEDRGKIGLEPKGGAGSFCVAGLVKSEVEPVGDGFHLVVFPDAAPGLCGHPL